MKKITCFFLLATCINARNTFAQNFYLTAGAGYAFAMPGQKLDQYGNILNGTVIKTASTSDYQLKTASFTSGVQGTVGVGLMLSKNIGIEVNGSINITSHNYKEILEGQSSGTGSEFTYVATRKAEHSVILMPSLLLQTAGSKCNLYMKMGPALPLNTRIKLNESYIYQLGYTNQYSWNITNYFTVGFTAATGIKIKLSDHITLHGEFSMLELNLSRKERDMETAILNGTSYPASQLKGITRYHYNKNGIADANGNEEALAQPFSNMAVSAGINYTLNDHSKKSTRQTN